MPGLAELILALALTGGSHEMGHQTEADRLNVPMAWGNDMVWKADTQDPEKLSRIANAGFEAQEILSGATRDTKLGKSISIVSALNKLGYALKPGGIQKGGVGDVRMIEQSKGKSARKVAQGALAVSAISDMLRAFGKTEGNMGFNFGQSSTGTPMLTYGGNF